MKLVKFLILSLIISAIGIACSGGGDTASETAPVATTAPTAVPKSTDTPVPPTATAVSEPTTAPVQTAIPAPEATAVPAPTTAPVSTATSVPPTATSVPPTATPVPPTATPVPTPVLPSADLFTSFSAGGWNASYAIDNGSLFLSSTETPGSKSVGNLNLDFMPAMAGQTHSNLKNQSLGFAFHEYTRIELDINKGIHVVAIPAGKTPFKLDLNIAVSGKGSDGNSCSTTITEQFTRSDDFYPSAALSIPGNAIPDTDKYKPFSIPSSTAQGLFLATSQSNYDDNYGEVRVNNTEGYFVKKPPTTLRVGLFGDVKSDDYETMRDYIEVLAVVAPDLDIAWANNISEVTLPIHLLSCTEFINETIDQYCNTSGPSGGFSDQWGSGNLATGWGFIRVSDQQMGSRHTLTHEFGHAMGLWHSGVDKTSMGPPNNQAGNWAAHDLMVIALIHNSAVVSGQTREEIRVAFNIADDELQGFINNPATLSNTPDAAWVELGDKLETQFNNSSMGKRLGR